MQPATVRIIPTTPRTPGPHLKLKAQGKDLSHPLQVQHFSVSWQLFQQFFHWQPHSHPNPTMNPRQVLPQSEVWNPQLSSQSPLGSTLARRLYSASVPKSIPSAFCSLILYQKQSTISTYVPKLLSRQRHISTRINVQLIRTKIPTPLSRRHIRLAVI